LCNNCSIDLWTHTPAFAHACILQVRLFVNVNTQVTSNLTQEFVRIRKSRESAREAIVLALCSRVYTSRCMVFVRSKVQAHRLRIIFGLAGLKVAELHGALTQTQRLSSLALFTRSEVDFLITTDLAGRGIDIPGVTCVINMSMPHTLKQYIHRVGRTARAGTEGRSVTLVGEMERKILRQIVKAGEGMLKSRVVAPKVTAAPLILSYASTHNQPGFSDAIFLITNNLHV
jgi:ATP-dependent RNA helicase DDX27